MAERDTTAGASGWVRFAGAMMVIVGWLNFFYGLAAILNGTVVVVGGHGPLIADVTAWGWVTLILAVILMNVGVGLLRGAEWARWAAVFFVTVNAIEQVWIFPAAPLWAFMVILLDVIILYHLATQWEGRDVAVRQSTESRQAPGESDQPA
jgi:hypothetical protein